MGRDASPEAPSPAGAADSDVPLRSPPAAAAEAAAESGAPRSAPQSSRRISKLVSVSEDSELAHMEAGRGAGGGAEAGSRGGVARAPSSSARDQLQPTGSVSAFGSASLSLMGPRGANGGDSERSKSAPPSPGGLAASAAATLQQRLRRAWADATHIWWGLPSACKLTMVLAGEQLRACPAASLAVTRREGAALVFEGVLEAAWPLALLARLLSWSR